MTKPLVYRWRDLLACEVRLTTTDRAVGWRSSDYGDARGRNIRPGSRRLAQDLGLTVHEGETRNKTVERALKRLVDLGYLIQVGAGFRGHAAEYHLSFPALKGGLHSPSISEKGGLHSPQRGTPQSPHQPNTREASPVDDIEVSF